MSDDGPKVDRGGVADGGEHSLSATPRSSVTDDLDTVFELLSDARRRHLLYYLFALDGSVVELEAVANAVYRYETAETGADDRTRETVRVDLHHSHLPRLADAGIVDYDHRQGTIRVTDQPAFEELVECARAEELD